ncbi:MAG: hypothetical protein ACQETE_13165 [Bacteroidota bacterium]
MKRIHLFEFEDQPWFPEFLRRAITRLIMVMHRLVGTADKSAQLLDYVINETGSQNMLDLGSGSGGPMPNIHDRLVTDYDHQELELTLSDLYPDREAAQQLNENTGSPLSYRTDPVNAHTVSEPSSTIRTMISGFHHLKPDAAQAVLRNAQDDRAPLFIYEMSDNSAPRIIRWISFPINLIICLFITFAVRPLSFSQLLFTYLIPIIPLCFAWDGAVSNARTYTLSDMEELLSGLPESNYYWERGVIEGPTNQLYLIGLPHKPSSEVPNI